MRFPLTERLITEAERYQLRSACRDCLFYVPAQARCAHGWPNRDQARGVADEASRGESDSVQFCKEFELA